MEFKLTTPVVFIIFNRPETTKIVFEEIRKAQPPVLFLIADGPRANKPGDPVKCAETRQIVDNKNIDWDCQVYRNFSEINLGCKDRISSGINWVFEQVEEAIILEDDCLPDYSFYRYCQELLELYRDEHRVMHIGGQNTISANDESEESYHFSKYVHIWGWATWKRAWNSYDVKMSNWPEFKRKQVLNDIFVSPWVRNFTIDLLDRVYSGRINTWDYQWVLTIQTNDGYAITPNTNLITNIGFGKEATHTKKANIFSNAEKKQMRFPLNHPKEVIRDILHDELEEASIRYSWPYKLPFPIFKVIRKAYHIGKGIK